MSRRAILQSLSGTAIICALVVLGAPRSLCQYVFAQPVHVAPDTFYQWEPSIGIDSRGNPYTVWWRYQPASPATFIWFAKSTDGGETFLPSVLVDSTSDGSEHPVIALDQEDNPHLAWTEYEGPTRWVKYSRSADKGETFLPVLHIHPDADEDQYVGAIAVDSKGNPMVVWHAFLEPPGGCKVFFARSYDRGMSFGPPVLVDPRTAYEIAPDMAVDDDDNIYITYAGDIPVGHQFIFMVRSTDGGRTFSDRVRVDTDGRISDFSSVAVVPESGGPWTGEGDVMVVWNEVRGSIAPDGIYFRRLTDRGATFGDVATVIEGDVAACPRIVVGRSGAPVVVWVSSRDHEVRFSLSPDGGRTFAPAQPVSSESLTDDGALDVAMTESEGLMVAWERFQWLQWPEDQVYFIKGKKVIGAEEVRSEEGRHVGLSLDQSSPSPFSHSTTILFMLPSRGAVKLDVYNSSGRLVRKLVDEELPAGRHQVLWDGKDESQHLLPSGTYFLKLESGGSSATRKTVLLR